MDTIDKLSTNNNSESGGETRVCVKCGAKVAINDKKCSNCGAAINNVLESLSSDAESPETDIITELLNNGAVTKNNTFYLRDPKDIIIDGRPLAAILDAHAKWALALENKAVSFESPNRANLKGACPENADLRGAILSYANFHGANLRCASLEGANLKGAILRDANLQGANLQNVDLSYGQAIGDNLRGAHLLRGIILSNLNFRYKNLSSLNLQSANFTSTDLSYANLNGSNLQGAIFRGAQLVHTNLRGANLEGANFTAANLFCADLRDANLRNARLINALLSTAAVDGANFEGASLDGSLIDDESLAMAGFSKEFIAKRNQEIAEKSNKEANEKILMEISNALQMIASGILFGLIFNFLGWVNFLNFSTNTNPRSTDFAAIIIIIVSSTIALILAVSFNALSRKVFGERRWRRPGVKTMVLLPLSMLLLYLLIITC